jgi:hypothetical protein
MYREPLTQCLKTRGEDTQTPDVISFEEALQQNEQLLDKKTT